MRACPWGTTGNEKATAYTPRCHSCSATALATTASPNMTGTIACSPGSKVNPAPCHTGTEACGVAVQTEPQVVGRLQQVEDRERGTDDGRSDRVGEQIGPGSLLEHLDDLASSCDVTAAGATQGLAEGPGDDVDPVADAEPRRRSSATFADEADRVRVVHHHECVVPVGECADLIERCVVAVHREDAVGDDQAVARIGCLLQPALQLGEVAVGVAETPRLAEPDPVDDAGVVERVGDDGVAVVEKRLEHSTVGVEARRKEDGVLVAEPGGQPCLQLAVDVLRTADESHRRHAEAALLQRASRSLEQTWVVSETEVVVRAQVEDLAPLGVADVRALGARQDAFGLVDARLAHLGDASSQLFPQRVQHVRPPTSRAEPCHIDRWRPCRTPPRTGRTGSGA